jgi:hypothetical protein
LHTECLLNPCLSVRQVQAGYRYHGTTVPRVAQLLLASDSGSQGYTNPLFSITTTHSKSVSGTLNRVSAFYLRDRLRPFSDTFELRAARNLRASSSRFEQSHVHSHVVSSGHVRSSPVLLRLRSFRASADSYSASLKRDPSPALAVSGRFGVFQVRSRCPASGSPLGPEPESARSTVLLPVPRPVLRPTHDFLCEECLLD